MAIEPGEFPVPRTWSDGDWMTGALLNEEIRDSFNWLLSPPSIKLSRKTDQTITNQTDTWIDWEFEDHKSGLLHSTNADENPERVTAQTPGMYLFTCRCEFASEAVASGRRDLWVLREGVFIIAVENGPQPADGAPTRLSLTGTIRLSVGDTMGAKVYQSSGGDLALTDDEVEFAMKWISR